MAGDSGNGCTRVMEDGGYIKRELEGFHIQICIKVDKKNRSLLIMLPVVWRKILTKKEY